MNFKRFALSAAAFGAVLALVSCEPIRGVAAEIGYDEQAGIYEYLDAGGQNLGLIDFRLDDDSDGKRSVRLQIYGLQSAMLNTQTQIYDNMDFSIAPDSVTVSGSGTSGVYKSRLDGKLHSMFCFGFNGMSGQIMNSDEFSVTLSFRLSEYQGATLPSTFYNISSGLSFGVRPSGYCARFYADLTCSTAYFSNWSYLSFGSMNENSRITWYISPDPYQDYIGALPAHTLQDNAPFEGGYKVVAYSGTTTTLPSGTVDTTKPWDYYNDVLLPYIFNTYNDIENIDQYLIFPDGYQEPEQPTTVPVINPTLPGFDFALETNGTEPVSDVNYNVPDMPGKDVSIPVFDFTQINPAEVMAPVAEGLRGIWQLVGMVLQEFELFPYVGLAIFAAIVLMLLRLGK